MLKKAGKNRTEIVVVFCLQMYYIKVIINNFDCSIYDLKETAEDLVNNFSRYGKFEVEAELKEVNEPTEIPEYFREHYYMNSYHDFY